MNLCRNARGSPLKRGYAREANAAIISAGLLPGQFGGQNTRSAVVILKLTFATTFAGGKHL